MSGLNSIGRVLDCSLIAKLSDARAVSGSIPLDQII